jgi:hypothetical protein
MIAAVQSANDYRGLAVALEQRARRAAAAPHPEPVAHAALLLGAADALRERPDTPSPDPLPLWERGRCAEAIRAALDEATFAAAWAKGQTVVDEPAGLATLLGTPLLPTTDW